ncbi:glycosyltransferase family 9 protein [Methylibium sp.]|uniref:glycosyltransferase family 9 protein n=1 Tax=Methylibium sp. TaxID=2067992 RepID=UPI003D09FE13
MKPFHPTEPPRRVLVICLRRLGDTLLSTALIRSLRSAWPGCRIDVLVPAASAPVLAGNPDIDGVITEPAQGGALGKWRLVVRLCRRYDLAISTLYNDRPHLYALIAGRCRVNVVPEPHGPGARWKRFFSSGWAVLELGARHAVDQYLVLADVLGLVRVSEVVAPSTADTTAVEAVLGGDWQRTPLAVLHPTAMYRYKGWTADGWRGVIEHLTVQRGLRVVLSGGPGDAERRSVEALVKGLTPAAASRTVNAAGRWTFAELAAVLRVARLYLGPDTSVTHLAAACGTPSVALFGPSHPVAWGPWPNGYAQAGVSPWRLKLPLQHVENVWLVQGEGACVPCLQEGCDRHVDSHSACLDGLAASRVNAVLDEVLAA